nr:MAG TPA: hypothetical protein [Caudoviricetes sp.]
MVVYLLITHIHFKLNHYCTSLFQSTRAIESRQERR